jgi:hypothetical protein
MGLMKTLKNFTISGLQFTRIKLVLLLAFSLLILFQFFIGFSSFDDYLIGFVYILFLNDLYIKVKRPETNFYNEDRVKRIRMSLIFAVLFSMPFALDAFNVTDETRAFFYRLGFIIWAQIFLLDAFVNYRQTHSKKWLLFTNIAALFIVIGAFIY